MRASHKLQLGVAVAGLAVFAVLLTERLTTLRVAAEQQGFEHAVATLRANLTAATTRALVQHDATLLAALHHANPGAWLPGALPGYVGALPGDHGVPEGAWYFDTVQRELVYKPRFPQGFRGSLGRLQLRVEHDDRDGDGRFTPGRDRLRSVGIVVVAGTEVRASLTPSS